MNALLIVVLLLVVIILVGNTMMAIAFLRGRRGDFKSVQGRETEAMDELHKRVQALPAKRK
ncbi:MAG: hypothetical protein V1755_11480 [Chloroflexota bacterium]